MANLIQISYQREIRYLQRHGDILLSQIKKQEIKMNKKKKQNQQPNERDVYFLDRMVKRFLWMLAVINCYQYFKLIRQPLTHNNRNFFNRLASVNYEDLLHRFLMQLRIRRMQLNSHIDFNIIQ